MFRGQEAVKAVSRRSPPKVSVASEVPQARICPPQLSPVEAGLLYDFPRNMIRSNGARLLIIMPLLCALASGVKTPFLLLGEDTIQQRLDLYKGNDSIREAALLKLFTEAGCQTANLSE